MGTAQELERLVVKLVGEGSGYTKVLDTAVKQTTAAARQINNITEREMAAHNHAMREAARITQAVATPTERYARKLTELSGIYRAGVITTKTYHRALTALNKEYKRGIYAVGAFGRKLQGAGRTMRNTGGLMTMAITLPVIGMVKSFADFDSAMTKSLAIMGDVSAKMRAEMEATATEISRNSTTSANALAESYFFLASAGMDAAQAVAALGTVEKFSVAGAFDMSTATDLLTDAQSALGLSSKDATKNMEGMVRVSDTLVKANTLANASVQEFSEALTNEAGAAIKQYNMDLEEGVAILATYADQGLKGNAAGSMMARMTRLLIKNINDNGKAFKKLNIDTEEFGKTGKNITGIINGITNAVAGMGPAQKAATLETLGFEARIQQAILPLLGMTKKIRGYDAALRKANGITKEIADKQLKSFTAQMKILWNRITEVSRAIGKELAPYITKLSDKLKIALDWFNGLSKEAKATTAIIIGLAAVFGPLLAVVGGVVISFGFLLISMEAIWAAGAKVVTALTGTTASATTASVGMGTLAATAARVPPPLAGVGVAAAASTPPINAMTVSAGMLSASLNTLAISGRASAGALALTGTASTAASGATIDATFRVIKSTKAATAAVTAGGVAVKTVGGVAVATLGWWVVAIVAVVAALWVVIDYIWGPGSVADAFTKAGKSVMKFTKKTIGWLRNIRENMGLLTEWIGSNWEMLVKDLGKMWMLTQINMAKNVLVFIKIQARVWSLWAGYMFGVFKSVFGNFGLLKWVRTGIKIAADIFVEFALGIFETLRNAFSSNNTDKLGQLSKDMGEQLSKDFKKGFDSENIMRDTADIIKEESKGFKGPLDGFERSTLEGPNYAYGKKPKPGHAASHGEGEGEGEGEGNDEFSMDAGLAMFEKFAAASDAMEAKTAKFEAKLKEKNEGDEDEDAIAAGSFKTMSLNRYAPTPVGQQATRVKRQEVTDKENGEKLDKLIELNQENRTQPAAMAK